MEGREVPTLECVRFGCAEATTGPRLGDPLAFLDHHTQASSIQMVRKVNHSRAV